MIDKADVNADDHLSALISINATSLIVLDFQLVKLK